MAKLRLEISKEEVEQLAKEYASLTGRRKPYLGHKEWMARALAGHFSQSWSVVATLRPVIEAELEPWLNPATAELR
jgi:hypothetical protein